MKTERIPLNLLDLNNGQLPGLPRNPRNWTVREIDSLKASIEETPELMEVRPILVVRHKDRFVAVGGNMRLSALRSMGAEDAVCTILPDDLGARKLKEVVIKDNAAIGEWDWDLLANEWSDYPLADYGIPVPYREEDAHKDAPAAPVDDRVVIEVKLSTDEFDFAIRTLRKYGATPEEAVLKLFGHEG